MIRPTPSPAAAVMAGLILITGATSVLAQTATPTTGLTAQEALRARGETYHRAPDSAQDPEELAVTAGLNARIVARNDAIARQEAADKAAHAEAEARYREAAAAAATLQANYEADQRAAVAARAEYDRARAVWEAMIRACEASGRHDCRANAPD